jgi:uncharacterized repeat protein (TIGR02543 family)
MTPANASTIPAANTQGGSEGVIYFTEATSGTIHIGDIGATPSTKGIFWQDSLSKVDQVAVTQTRIAWASRDVNSNMRTSVMISNIGDQVGTVTTVDFNTLPSDGIITSLTADTFGERFYITTSVGDIWLIPSAGGSPTRVFNSSTNAGIATAVGQVFWGSWFDSYNSKFYFCTYSSSSATAGRVYVATVTGSTMATPALVKRLGSDVTVEFCDGLGVNPSTQEIFALSAHPTFSPTAPFNRVNWSRITSDGIKTNVTQVRDDSNDLLAGAPSSMFVSHVTGKLYFASETRMYESNFDGSNTRVLYTGTNMQNIAVYYGASISTIDNFINPTVIFDSNGASQARVFQHGSSAAALTQNSFTRSGYTFAGWNTLSNGTGTAFADGVTFPFTSYTTLFAQWTLIPAPLSDPASPTSSTAPANTTSPTSSTAPATVASPPSTAPLALAATGLDLAGGVWIIGVASGLVIFGSWLVWMRRGLRN